MRVGGKDRGKEVEGNSTQFYRVLYSTASVLEQPEGKVGLFLM